MMWHDMLCWNLCACLLPEACRQLVEPLQQSHSTLPLLLFNNIRTIRC